MHESADELDYFLSLPTDVFCQQTVANWQQISWNVLTLGPKPIVTL
jgi:hypothetical protein